MPTFGAQSSKLRLAVLGATYATLEPRKKIGHLATHFDLTCITGPDYEWYGQKNRLADQPEPADYRLIGLPYIGRPQTSTRYLLRGLGRLFAKETFDIILVETEPWAFLRWQAWFWKSIRQKRALFGEFTWENVERSGLKGAFLNMAYRLAANTANFAIAGNQQAGEILAKHGMAQEDILVAPQLGIDELVFRPPTAAEHADLRKNLGVPTAAFVIGFCGRLEDAKGVLDLFDAVSAMRGRLPELNIHLAVKGGGCLLPHLESLREQHPWLHIYGVSFHHEVAAYMQALDLFVLPSRAIRQNGKHWREQFGHVLIEAMSCGVATIGSDCGAIPEVIGREECIFPQGDVAALSRMLFRYADSAGQRRAIAEHGRRRVLEKYTNRVLSETWARFMCRMHEAKQQA